MGSAASWECWDTGLIPSSAAQWVEDPVLPQLQLRSRLWLGPDPWPWNSICHGAAKKEKKKKAKIARNGQHLITYSTKIYGASPPCQALIWVNKTELVLTVMKQENHQQTHWG